jgi:hypothetical protein
MSSETSASQDQGAACDYCLSEKGVTKCGYTDPETGEDCFINLCDSPQCHNQFYDAMMFAQEVADSEF